MFRLRFTCVLLHFVWRWKNTEREEEYFWRDKAFKMCCLSAEKNMVFVKIEYVHNFVCWIPGGYFHDGVKTFTTFNQ